MMPGVYEPVSSTARIIEALYGSPSAVAPQHIHAMEERINAARQAAFGDRNPATIVFVNSIASANELLGHIQNYVPGIRSNGHTTDYGLDRANVEDDFTRGNLDLIVATKGLEVGVDFDRVNVGIIYGMPFYLSDYTQRAGRIGRRGSCLIVNVFMPDRPLDYFYYRNWRILCDSDLRDIQMANELYRIERENPEALARSAQRAVLDFIATLPDGDILLDANVSGSNLAQQQSIAEVLRSDYCIRYVEAALRSDPSNEVVRNSALAFIQQIISNLPIHGRLRRILSRGLGEAIHALRSLRTIERQVPYQIPGEDRPVRKNLSYAIRHCVPGQVKSYRGFYFIVDFVEEYGQQSFPNEA